MSDLQALLKLSKLIEADKPAIPAPPSKPAVIEKSCSGSGLFMRIVGGWFVGMVFIVAIMEFVL